MILRLPLPARLKKPAVKAVVPNCTSPAATATAIGCAASNGTISASRPSALKQPLSRAMKIGEEEVSGMRPIFTGFNASAEAGVAREMMPIAAAQMREQRPDERRFGFKQLLPQKPFDPLS